MVLETQFDNCEKGNIGIGGLYFSLFWFRDFLVVFFFFQLAHVDAVLTIPGEEVTK